MTNFEKMTNSIFLSDNSGIPFLFVGNPGAGKTTIAQLWAEKNGYHMEEIMGASFDRSEVLGYMVNVNGRLEMLEPFWFRRIRELAEQGKKSVLFIDELSTTNGDVQSALLRLIFERTIGNGDKLPEGTIIISAANFKGNLPGYCDVSSPTLNRFCMINVDDDNLENMVDEYVINDLPAVKSVKFGNITKDMHEVSAKIGNALKKVFIKYASSSSDNEEKSLNPLNHNLQIYDLENEQNTKRLCNFISGRCLSHLKKVVISLIKSDIDIENMRPLMQSVVEGLIGAGTNNFMSETIQDAYIAYATDSLMNEVAALRKYVTFTKAPAYETITEKMVETVKASSNDVNVLFENVRRNVEYNPEEKEQIEKDIETLAAALKIRGRNFEKKYKDPMFAAFCTYMTEVYAGYAKKQKLNMDTVKYIKWYVRRMNENNVAA